MKSARLFIQIPLVLCCALLLSCSKKGASGGGSILENTSIRHIPSSAIAFMTWDTTSPGYKAYRSSPWGKGGSAQILETAKSLARQANEEKFEHLVDVLTKTGLLTTGGDQAEVIKDAAGFITTDPGSHAPGVGVYLSAASGANFKDKLSALESVLKSDGYGLAKRAGSQDGFVLTVPGPAEKKVQVYFAATQDVMAIASQESLLAGAFAEPSGGAVQSLRQTPEFQKTMGSLSPAGDQVTLAFVDLKRLVGELRSAVPVEAADTDGKITAALNSFPGEALAWSRSMSPALSDSIIIAMSAQTEDQKRLVGALQGAGQVFSFRKLPADVLIGLTVDGQFLKNLKGLALGELTAEKQAQISSQLSFLDGLESLSIALRGSSGGSPFPELALVGTGSNVEAIAASFQAGIDQMLSGASFKLGPWQKKQIDQAQVDYLMSPLGVGAFLARGQGTAILGSSEKIVADTLRAQTGAAAGLGESLPTGAEKLLKANKPLTFGYANFDRIASMLESVQGSLALFTGGKGGIPPDKIQYLKDLGAMAFSLGSDAGVIRIESSCDSIKPQ